MMYKKVTLTVLMVLLQNHLFPSFFIVFLALAWYLHFWIRLVMKMINTMKRNKASTKKMYSMLLQKLKVLNPAFW